MLVSYKVKNGTSLETLSREIVSAEVHENKDALSFLERAEKLTPAGELITQSVGSPFVSSHLDEATLRPLSDQAGLKWDPAFLGRDVPYFLSDERVNSYGDITLQSWDFTQYRANPVFALSHDWGGMGIGRGVDYSVVHRREGGAGGVQSYDGPALAFRGLFMPESLSKEADRAFRMVQAGFFTGISPGLQPQTVIEVTDPKEREALGLGRYGIIMANNLLIEASPTLIPANSGALALQSLALQAKTHGITGDDLEMARQLERSRCQRRGDAEEWGIVDRAYYELSRTMSPRSRPVALSFEDVSEHQKPALSAEGEAAATQAVDTLEPVALASEAVEALMGSMNSLASIVSETFGAIMERLDDLALSIAGDEPDDEDEDDEDELFSLDPGQLKALHASVDSVRAAFEMKTK